jgi:hypothetical protein
MPAGQILTGVAIILLAAAVWDDLRRGDRVTPARKTYLLVACLFGLASAVLAIFS